MYIGETDNPAHLFSEAYDNALDETQSGYSEKVVVRVDTKNYIYEVQDFGRGIPIGQLEIRDEDGTVIKKAEILEVLCTKTASGAKFNSQSYRLRTGLHGVGLVCINALSEEMIIQTRRDGKKVTFHTKKGKKVSLEVTDLTENDQPPGVTVRFKPDPEIFRTTEIPLDYIVNRCKVANAFGFKVELFVDGEPYDLGQGTMADLLPSAENATTFCDIPIEVRLEDGQFMKTLIRYTSDTRDAYRGFTNLLYNSAGGTHVRMLQDSIKQVWTPYIEGRTINPGDVLLGVRATVAVFISDPAFSSQTKERLTVDRRDLEPLFSKFRAELKKVLDSDEKLREGLLKRFEEYRLAQNKLLSQKEIRDLVKLGEAGGKGIRRKSVVAKLNECRSPNREGTELYIVEGDSAGGTACAARDPYYQAILPIRGKILNVTYRDLKHVLKNEEVRSIVNSIGCGVGEESDADRSRYERVIIMCDADADGKNIAALLISLFVNIMPDMIKKGRVFLALPPLYGYRTKKGEFVPVYNREDLPEGIHFTRYKGLGEMDSDELKAACMTPATRKLLEVTFPEDVDEFNKILGTSHRRFELLVEKGVIVNKRGDFFLDEEIAEESDSW